MAYNVLTQADARNKFIAIFKEKVIPVRKGADQLLAWIEQTDFFSAPASTRFHGAFEGGLCNHSLAVYEQLLRVNQAWSFNFTEAQMALVALCHDLTKCNCYKVSSRNVKNDRTGQWEKVPFYQFEEQAPFGFHGPKSAFIVQSFVRLTWEEGCAIACHMGFSDQQNMNSVSNVYGMYSLAWALHVADEAASWVDGI